LFWIVATAAKHEKQKHGKVPTDSLLADVSIARHPWHHPEKIFALLNDFYPVPQGKNLRPTPFMPYLTWAPSAWVLPLKFTGGGLSAPGKMMVDSQGNVWAGDNFIVGAQNQDALWAGNLSKESRMHLSPCPRVIVRFLRRYRTEDDHEDDQLNPGCARNPSSFKTPEPDLRRTDLLHSEDAGGATSVVRAIVDCS
jgi:hypothetical protein